jgi:hypothetical protein
MYEHLGKEIGYGEVVRVKAELKKKIAHLLDNPDVDSPVFLFLPSLPSLAEKEVVMKAAVPAPAAAPVSKESFAELMENFRKAEAEVKKPIDWMTVSGVLKALQEMQFGGRLMDIHSLFEAAEREGRAGVTRKAQEVDARPAVPGEVVVTQIADEGKETQSKPAAAGDMVVRNRAASPPATKNTW